MMLLATTKPGLRHLQYESPSWCCWLAPVEPAPRRLRNGSGCSPAFTAASARSCRAASKLGQINSTIQDPLARFNAVMALPDLFTVEPAK